MKVDGTQKIGCVPLPVVAKKPGGFLGGDNSHPTFLQIKPLFIFPPTLKFEGLLRLFLMLVF